MTNFRGQIGPLGMFSKARHWEKKDSFSSIDFGALVIAELDKEVFKINYKIRPATRAYFQLLHWTSTETKAFFCSSAVLAHFRSFSSTINTYKKNLKRLNYNN